MLVVAQSLRFRLFNYSKIIVIDCKRLLSSSSSAISTIIVNNGKDIDKDDDNFNDYKTAEKLLDIVRKKEKNNEQIDWFVISKDFDGMDALELSFLYERIKSSPPLLSPPVKRMDRKEAKVYNRKIDTILREYIQTNGSMRLAWKAVKEVYPDLDLKTAKSRYVQLKTRFTKVELEKLYEMSTQGYSLKEISSKLNKYHTACDKHLKMIHSKMSDTNTIRSYQKTDTSDDNNSLKNMPKSLSVLLRRQFKVIGNDQKTLSDLFLIPKVNIKYNIARASTLWQTVNTASDMNKSRFQKKWNSKEVSILKQLVEKELEKSNRVDWNYVGTVLKRVPDTCKVQYRKLCSDIRRGKYSAEEDLILISNWTKFRSQWKQYNTVLPQRRLPESISSRISILFRHCDLKSGIGYKLCSNANIDQADIEQFRLRN